MCVCVRGTRHPEEEETLCVLLVSVAPPKLVTKIVFVSDLRSWRIVVVAVYFRCTIITSTKSLFTIALLFIDIVSRAPVYFILIIFIAYSELFVYGR